MTVSLRRCFLSLAFCFIPLSLMAQQRVSVTLPDAPQPESESFSTSAQNSSTEPGQQTSAGADASKQTDSKSPRSQSSADQVKAEEKQRLLGIMPAFNTVESGQAAPLKPSQKLDLWYHSAIDPFTFTVAGIDAGIEQAENTYPEYHQGVEGFAKRFGAAYADSVDGNFWGNGVLPIVLHQDPRYFRLGHGSAKRRLLYAALSTVRCKGDNGNWQPNISNVAGNLIGGAISNLYYPAADRGLGLTFERGLTVTGEGAFGALAFEFYPDLVSYWKRRHQAKAGAADSAGAPKTSISR